MFKRLNLVSALKLSEKVPNNSNNRFNRLMHLLFLNIVKITVKFHWHLYSPHYHGRARGECGYSWWPLTWSSPLLLLLSCTLMRDFVVSSWSFFCPLTWFRYWNIIVQKISYSIVLLHTGCCWMYITKPSQISIKNFPACEPAKAKV